MGGSRGEEARPASSHTSELGRGAYISWALRCLQPWPEAWLIILASQVLSYMSLWFFCFESLLSFGTGSIISKGLDLWLSLFSWIVLWWVCVCTCVHIFACWGNSYLFTEGQFTRSFRQWCVPVLVTESLTICSSSSESPPWCVVPQNMSPCSHSCSLRKEPKGSCLVRNQFSSAWYLSPGFKLLFNPCFCCLGRMGKSDSSKLW